MAPGACRAVNRPFSFALNRVYYVELLLSMNLSELTFHKHPAGFQATVRFENSYGLSIIPESDGKHYEVAVLKEGFITYESGLTEDVFRYLSVDSVDSIAAVASRLQA
jgi:hypothetical protein